MDDGRFSFFERVVRKAGQFTEAPAAHLEEIHPFEERDIHPRIPKLVKRLFDDGYYAQAVFEAFKFLEKEVQRLSGVKNQNGFKLMMRVFSPDTPIIRLTPLETISDKDEQKGFQFIFGGSVLAIRNPRGHEYTINDTPGKCLDYLSLLSLLLRKLDESVSEQASTL